MRLFHMLTDIPTVGVLLLNFTKVDAECGRLNAVAMYHTLVAN
jgi:hypothetical protein